MSNFLAQSPGEEKKSDTLHFRERRKEIYSVPGGEGGEEEREGRKGGKRGGRDQTEIELKVSLLQLLNNEKGKGTDYFRLGKKGKREKEKGWWNGAVFYTKRGKSTEEGIHIFPL